MTSRFPGHDRGMLGRLACSFVLVMVLAVAPHVAAQPRLELDPRLLRIVEPWRYDEERRFERGWNRGADVVAAGGVVRAPVSGRVRFVGRVAGRLVATLDARLGGAPAVVTLTGLDEVRVAKGAIVSRGEVVGRAGEFHVGAYDPHRRSRYLPVVARQGASGREGDEVVGVRLGDALADRLAEAVAGVASTPIVETTSPPAASSSPKPGPGPSDPRRPRARDATIRTSSEPPADATSVALVLRSAARAAAVPERPVRPALPVPVGRGVEGARRTGDGGATAEPVAVSQPGAGATRRFGGSAIAKHAIVFGGGASAPARARHVPSADTRPKVQPVAGAHVRVQPSRGAAGSGSGVRRAPARAPVAAAGIGRVAARARVSGARSVAPAAVRGDATGEPPGGGPRGPSRRAGTGPTTVVLLALPLLAAVMTVLLRRRRRSGAARARVHQPLPPVLPDSGARVPLRVAVDAAARSSAWPWLGSGTRTNDLQTQPAPRARSPEHA